MASTGLRTALRRLPPSTISQIQSFLPAIPLSRQYATPTKRSGPLLPLPPSTSTSTRDALGSLDVAEPSKPRRVRKRLHVDMELREFDDIRGIQEALRTGHVDDAIRLAAEYVGRIALSLRGEVEAEHMEPGSSSKPTMDQATRDKVYPLLGLFLDVPDRPELYARVLRKSVEKGCLSLDPELASERHMGHIGSLAGTAMRASDQGWIDNLSVFVPVPGPAGSVAGEQTYPDHPSRVIAALLGDRRFINRTTAIHKLFMGELERAGIEVTKHWSFLPWVMIAGRLRQYRHVLAIQQQSAAYIQHIHTTQPSRQWTEAEVSAISKLYELVLRSWIESQSGYSGSRSPVAVGSMVPSHLSQQLIDTLGSRIKLPTTYIRQWMICERLAQRYHVAKVAWDIFDLSPAPTPIDRWLISQVDPEYRDSRPRPDIYAWGEYFTLRRALPRDENEPRLQEMLRRMYDTVPIASFTTSTLNEVLALFAHGSQFDHGHEDPNENLPMLLFLLRRYDYDPAQDFGPAPNARTINLAGAALINLWRCFGRYFDPVFGLHAARMARQSRQLRYKGSLLDDEWRMLNVVIRDLLPEDEGERMDISLPLLKLRPEQGAHRRPVEKRFIDFDELDDLDLETPSTPAHTLLRPMMYLVERAIKLVLSERHETEAENELAFQKLMERVYNRILPQSQGWLKVGTAEGAGEWTVLRDPSWVFEGAKSTDGKGYPVNEPEEQDDVDEAL